MIHRLIKEHAFYKGHPRNMRLLLMTNLIYALVLPIIEMFVGAYIMRSTADTTLVVSYQLALYTGIPVTFLINGYLLKKIKIVRLYSFGMLLSGVSMTAMMLSKNLDIYGITIAGLIMGLSYGFFWANRDFLSLASTTDENRNYYFGLETFFYTLTFVFVPFLAGNFIALTVKGNWFSGVVNVAYYILTGTVFLLTIFSSYIIHQGNYTNPKGDRFIFLKFDPLWYRMLVLAALKGIAQGVIVTAPIMLIMKLVGEEGVLGTLQAIAAILSAFVLYLIGRFAKPKHRLNIFTAGLVIFAVGFAINSVLYSAVGVIIVLLCITIARPLLDVAYFPIQLGLIDYLAEKEKRNKYAYIFNHEFGLYLGRFFGALLFLVLASYASEDFALKYALLTIALIQLGSIWFAKDIIKRTKSAVDLQNKQKIADNEEMQKASMPVNI
jgi:MFS transporter, YQGE family, putative transporter